jgi:hypothetical protein
MWRDREPEIAVVLVGIALGLSTAAACVSVEAVQVQKDAQITCRYGDIDVFTGGISLYGNGADTFEAEGVYSLCRDDKLRCWISGTSTVAQ